MSRMLKALQQLDNQRPAASTPRTERRLEPSPPPLSEPTAVAVAVEEPSTLDLLELLFQADSGLATLDAPADPFAPTEPFAPTAAPAIERRPAKSNLLWPSEPHAEQPLPLELDVDDAEPYDSLASRIAEQHAGEQTSVVLLAGPTRWREADFSPLALAAALGQCDARGTLLVDLGQGLRSLPRPAPADAREPVDRVWLGQAGWSKVSRTTSLPRLSVAWGDGADMSANSGGDPWEGLRGTYRFVVVVGGGLNEGLAARLAPRCDGVYLVVCLHVTKRRAAQESLAGLQADGARVLGCIVAAPDRT